MWIYEQSSGRLYQDDTYVDTGYSGLKPEGWNNPDKEDVVGVGPLPRGEYSFTELLAKDGKLGPNVLAIEPKEGTDTHGRSEFRMHGNDAENNASHGCLIFRPETRLKVWNSGDHDLTVVRDDSEVSA